MGKQAMRSAMIKARQALTSEERAERSIRAQLALLASDDWERAETVLLYLSIRGEVETGLLAETALAQGKRLLLPRVEQTGHQLWFHQWSGSEQELTTGAYGILEPRPELPVVDPAEVDLVVVPGVAFDRRCHRLGYGGGYYDRALPGMRRARKVGLCYSRQVVPALPAEAHDVRLDRLATEEGIWPPDPEVVLSGDDIPLLTPERLGLPYGPALAAALAEVAATPGARAAVLFGSVLTGFTGPNSDLDLYVILDDAEAWQQIRILRPNEVEVEMHFAPASLWQERLESRAPVIVSAFASGQVVWGEADQLMALGRSIYEAGPKPLTQEEIDRYRYHLTDLAGDLADVAGDRAQERYLGTLLLDHALEGYIRLNQGWGDKSKRRVSLVACEDDEVGRLAYAFLKRGQVSAVQELVDWVLAPFGGRLRSYEGPRRPV